ncbi:MAG: DUF6132 family protein [Sandaracinus sp.]
MAGEQDPDLEALTRSKRRATIRALAFMIAGALIGVATHAVAGCPDGTCVLWATPERASIYGAVMGLLVAML